MHWHNQLLLFVVVGFVGSCSLFCELWLESKTKKRTYVALVVKLRRKFLQFLENNTIGAQIYGKGIIWFPCSSYHKHHRPTKGLCLACNSQAKGQLQACNLLAMKLVICDVCVRRLCGEMPCKLLVKVVNFDGCPTLVQMRSTPAWTMSEIKMNKPLESSFRWRVSSSRPAWMRKRNQ